MRDQFWSGGGRTRVGLAAALACTGLLAATALPLHAEADGPDHFAVTGVAENDVLNIRAAPDAGAEKIGEIAPDADGIANLGCKGGLAFAEWQTATEAERAAAEGRRWCRISWQGVEGWVAARYLTEGGAPAAGASGTDAAWSVVSVDGASALGEAFVVFSADGSVFGSSGCNRFRGGASQAGDRLVLSGPLAGTRMACDGALMSQEDALLSILAASPAVAYSLFADRLSLTTADGRAVLLAKTAGRR